MLAATYNIQWGKGRDGRVDLARIVSAIAAADVVGLQEVERNWRMMDHADQVRRVAELMPDRHVHFAPSVDVDGSRVSADGRVIGGRRQFGLLVLSRWPILSARSFPLPKYPVHGFLNDAGILLEAVIGHPRMPFRLYTTHLNYASEHQRLLQVRLILEIIADAPRQGGIVADLGAPDDAFGRDWMMLERHELPPMPEPAILLGDFNMRTNSPEYAAITGAADPDYGRRAQAGLFGDALTLAGIPESQGITYPERGPIKAKRVDHVFVTSDLAGRVQRAWIDEKADGSDHQPVFAELNFPA